MLLSALTYALSPTPLRLITHITHTSLYFNRYLTPTRTTLIYELPLAEVITDFFDQLKSRTKGYASMSFQEIGFREDNLVRLDIKINGEEATPLATIVR